MVFTEHYKIRIQKNQTVKWTTERPECAKCDEAELRDQESGNDSLLLHTRTRTHTLRMFLSAKLAKGSHPGVWKTTGSRLISRGFTITLGTLS